MSERSETPRWILRLFPRGWRDRYADEFLALIEERPPGPRDTLDIVVSALDARLRPRAWGIAQAAEGQLLMAGAPDPATPPQRITVGRPGLTPAQRRSAAQRRFTRREFLRNAVLGGVGVAAIAGGVSATQFGLPNKTSVFGKEVIVPRNLLPAPGDPPYKHLPGKFWLINNQDGALALYWKCPHLGCTVPWTASEGQFHCPCHQSIYDRHGAFVSGPAPRSMDLMALRVDELGNLVVHTGEITERDDYDPSQAVKIDAI
ncbi:MAG: Rieske 2Fe-2S domain-containing protein [Thermomicrobiales bacterium]